jgi:SagB-type dehydrogenase family enzyme
VNGKAFMTGECYRLSPYCVFSLGANGKSVHVVHGLYGSRFEIAADLFGRLFEDPERIVPDEVAAAVPPAAAAIATLIEEKLLIPADEADALAASDPFIDRLSPLELAFHRGFGEGGFVREDIDPTAIPPATKPPLGTEVISLASHATGEDEISLRTCLEQRRSSRAFGPGALSRARFERFLELTCRAKALRETPGLGWVSVRNYPSAGARYPLEIYPIVLSVDGLTEGIYHYRPLGHRLEAVPSDRAHRDALCDAACHRMGTHNRPAALFIITAVFARTCWKYRGMSYHAILMETGALYQTMYLAAAALDLAPCAIGAFPERATAEMLGIDTRDEAQVGLFALGNRDDAPPRPRIVAVQRDTKSPFATDAPDGVIELRFEDGTRQVVPRAELTLARSPDGTICCCIGRRCDIADIADQCRDDALLLLQSSMPKPGRD